MAEIKSTLDLIMERTKNLTLTEDEKKVLHRDEQVSRVKGWVQRYEDRVLRTAEIRKELNAELKDLLRREIIERLEPGSSNDILYQMLEEVLDINRAPFETVAERFNWIIEGERDRQEAEQLEALAAAGISGSAVVPNPEGDPEWNRFNDRIREEFRGELLAIG